MIEGGRAEHQCVRRVPRPAQGVNTLAWCSKCLKVTTHVSSHLPSHSFEVGGRAWQHDLRVHVVREALVQVRLHRERLVDELLVVLLLRGLAEQDADAADVETWARGSNLFVFFFYNA